MTPSRPPSRHLAAVAFASVALTALVGLSPPAATSASAAVPHTIPAVAPSALSTYVKTAADQRISSALTARVRLVAKGISY